MKQQDVQLENMITDIVTGGNLKFKVKKKIIHYLTTSVQNKYVIRMVFEQESDIYKITSLIKKMDKNFKSHIQNVYNDSFPIINTQFLLNLKHGTFIYVDGNHDHCNTTDRNDYIILYIFGKHKQYVANKISNYIHQYTGDMVCYSISAHVGNGRDYWDSIASTMTKRSFDTLYFNNNITGEIKNHLDRWVANENIYKKRNLIFKTDILIHGIAGTGKSSLATAIASYLNCNIINIDTTTFEDLNISEVKESIVADNMRYVILLDEIDSIFKNRNDDISESQNNKITKLLTFLDGPNSPTNVVFVATTNYIDRLDEAVIRKGRFDKIIEVGDMNKNTAIRMCKNFGLDTDEIDRVLRNYKSDFNSINPAKLQSDILDTIKINVESVNEEE